VRETGGQGAGGRGQDGRPQDVVAGKGLGKGRRGRQRRHRFPARPRALEVLCSDDEHSMILQAAEISGLRPSSCVAAAALAMPEQVHSDRLEAG